MLLGPDSPTSGTDTALPRGSRLRPAAKIAGVYLLVGGLWILTSDWVVEQFTGSDSAFMTSRAAQTLKGFFYVALTGSMLWALIERLTRALEAVNIASKRRETAWRAMLNEIPVAVCVVHEGRTIYANNAALSLLGPIELLLDRPFLDCVAPQHRTEASAALANLGQHERTDSGRFPDLKLLAADGRPLDVQITAIRSAIKSNAFDLAIVDVTERTRLALLAQQAERQQAAASIAAGVAHDFNNTFAAILGQATLARMHRDISEETDRSLEIIENLSSQTAGLTRSLLNFARVPGPDRRVRPVAPVLNSIRELSRGMLSRTIELEFRATDLGDAHCLLDEGAFIRAVLNLVANAKDALGGDDRPGRRISILACRVDNGSPHGAMQLSVTDNGEGIPPDVLPRLFTAFFTTKPSGKGTGLGLMLTKSTVEEHTGSIRITSERGRGSTFVIELPLVPAQPALSKAEREGRTVLLAEDNTAVRAAVAAMLRSAGFRVIETADGADFMRTRRGHPEVGVLLIDVNLPDLSGAQCLSRIREEEASEGSNPNSPTPAILMSGGVFPELEPEHRLRTTLLPKPFSKGELVTAIESALSSALV